MQRKKCGSEKRARCAAGEMRIRKTRQMCGGRNADQKNASGVRRKICGLEKWRGRAVDMQVRKSTEADLSRILEIYGRARKYMKENGNPSQWGSAYPPEELLKADIRDGISYVLAGDDGRVHGTFVFFIGEDPTYKVIREGRWLNEAPYGVIHRVAGDGEVKGIVAECVKYCFGICPNLRMDTHRDNLTMQGALEKQGFKRCGLINLANGSERIAYHKV